MEPLYIPCLCLDHPVLVPVALPHLGQVKSILLCLFPSVKAPSRVALAPGMTT